MLGSLHTCCGNSDARGPPTRSPHRADASLAAPHAPCAKLKDSKRQLRSSDNLFVSMLRSLGIQSVTCGLSHLRTLALVLLTRASSVCVRTHAVTTMS